MILFADWIGGAIQGATNIINGILNKRSADKANQTNIKLAQESNDLQYKMFQEQNQWNKDTSKEFFDMENAYNDPSAQRDRLAAAGFNPYVAMSDGVSSVAADATTPQGSFSPSVVTPTVQPSPSILNGVLQGVTQAMVDVAQAKKLGVDTRNVESMITRQIREMDIKNDWDQFRMELDKFFSFSDRSWQNETFRLNAEKVGQEIGSLAQDIINKQKQGEIYDVEKAIKNYEKAVSKIRSEYEPKMLKQSLINAVKQGNAIDASADASRASAGQSRAQTEYINRQKSLLGQTINGVEVDQETLKAWREQVKNSAIADTQKAKIEQALRAIELGNSASSIGQILYGVKDAFRYLPVVGDVLDTIVKFAK